METFKLKATLRERTGNQVGALRREDKIPAVVYGQKIDSVSLTLDGREFERVYRDAGESSLIELAIEGQEGKTVVIRDIQRHPLRGNITHADFYEIKRGQVMELSIELELVGEAPAVKTHGAMLVKSLDSVDVRCLPKDLVQSIEVSLEAVKEIGDIIQVKDLTLPEGIEVLTDPEESVVVASSIAEEKDEEPAEAEGVETVEVIGQEKKEGEAEAKPGEVKSDDK